MECLYALNKKHGCSPKGEVKTVYFYGLGFNLCPNCRARMVDRFTNNKEYRKSIFNMAKEKEAIRIW